MTTIPNLELERLPLRPFRMSDAPAVQKLAGAYEIAETTVNIPHPYPDGAAEEWIATHPETYEKGQGVAFAIERRADHTLVGAIGLSINKKHRRAELGYWIGKPYWNQGYATEAAREVVRYGFDDTNLNRIQARHMNKNPASGRVMEKIGMQYEGTLRQALHRFDEFEDALVYGILQDDYQAQQDSSDPQPE